MQENRSWDKIRIRNLEVYAYHGVFPRENEKGQHFYVNAELFLSTKKAGTTDELAWSVNYAEVCALIRGYMTGRICKLLEAAAEGLAEEILLRFPPLQAVRLEIRKPEAPIPYPFESVSVEICREWKRAVVACGSNLGDKRGYLDGAVEQLGADKKCRIVKVSRMIQTRPYGGVEQEDFLNGALLLETLYEPEELLTLLNRIEDAAGRERTVRWGPRTLDLDLIFYEDEVTQTKKLTVPHADMQNRDFVLIPLSELVPAWRHPLLNKTVTELLRELEKTCRP